MLLGFLEGGGLSSSSRTGRHLHRFWRGQTESGGGGGVADTRLVSKIGKGERSTGAVSSRLFVATAETCAGGYFADGIAVGMMIQMLVAS